MKKTSFIVLTFIILSYLVGEASLGVGKEVTISWWDLSYKPGSAQEISQQKVLRMFEKEYPNIKVDLVSIPQKDFYPKLMTAFIGGAAPEVVRIQPFYNMIAAAKGGWIRPLDDLVAQSKVLNPQDWYQLEAYKWQGKLWALPNAINLRRIGYNLHVYNELGLTPPRTWDELRANAKKATRDTDGDGKLDQFGWGAVLYEDTWLVYQFGNFLAMNNAYVVGPDLKTVLCDEEPFIQTLEFYAELGSKYGIPGIVTLDQDTLAAAFRTKKIAMFSMGSWWQGVFDAFYGKEFQYKRDYDSVINPSGPQRLKPGVPKTAAVGDAWAWALSKGAPHPGEGWKLLEFLGRPDIRAIYNEESPNCPVEAWLGREKWGTPWWKDYQETLRAGPVLPPVQPFSKVFESYRLIVNTVKAAILGRGTPKELAMKLATDVKKLVEE